MRLEACLLQNPSAVISSLEGLCLVQSMSKLSFCSLSRCLSALRSSFLSRLLQSIHIRICCPEIPWTLHECCQEHQRHIPKYHNFVTCVCGKHASAQRADGSSQIASYTPRSLGRNSNSRHRFWFHVFVLWECVFVHGG